MLEVNARALNHFLHISSQILHSWYVSRLKICRFRLYIAALQVTHKPIHNSNPKRGFSYNLWCEGYLVQDSIHSYARSTRKENCNFRCSMCDMQISQYYVTIVVTMSSEFSFIVMVMKIPDPDTFFHTPSAYLKLNFLISPLYVSHALCSNCVNRTPVFFSIVAHSKSLLFQECYI